MYNEYIRSEYEEKDSLTIRRYCAFFRHYVIVVIARDFLHYLRLGYKYFLILK